MEDGRGPDTRGYARVVIIDYLCHTTRYNKCGRTRRKHKPPVMRSPAYLLVSSGNPTNGWGLSFAPFFYGLASVLYALDDYLAVLILLARGVYMECHVNSFREADHHAVLDRRRHEYAG